MPLPLPQPPQAYDNRFRDHQSDERYPGVAAAVAVSPHEDPNYLRTRQCYYNERPASREHVACVRDDFYHDYHRRSYETKFDQTPQDVFEHPSYLQYDPIFYVQRNHRSCFPRFELQKPYQYSQLHHIYTRPTYDIKQFRYVDGKSSLKPTEDIPQESKFKPPTDVVIVPTEAPDPLLFPHLWAVKQPPLIKEKSSWTKICIITLLVIIAMLLAAACTMFAVIIIKGNNMDVSFQAASPTPAETDLEAYFTEEDVDLEDLFSDDQLARKNANRQAVPTVAPNLAPIPDDDSPIVPDDDAPRVPSQAPVITTPSKPTQPIPVIPVPTTSTGRPNIGSPIGLPTPLQSIGPTHAMEPCDTLDCMNLYYNYYLIKKSGKKNDKYYLEREPICDDDEPNNSNANGHVDLNSLSSSYTFNDDE